jgi:pimeloyl-ACP methyl ester carboxylesterase
MAFKQATSPQVVGISTSQSLQRFDLPLLRSLSRQYPVAQWQFCQDLDRPIDLDVAIASLHDYLQTCQDQVHLVGHGIAGLVGWLYTRQYPDRVRSLTLLSVGVNLATSWHSHYYEQRQLMCCSRETILTRSAFYLFGYRDKEILYWLANLLKEDLDNSLIPHSIYAPTYILPTALSVPMLVCGAVDDYVIGEQGYKKWKSYFKDSDRLWISQHGKHFFHYSQSQSVSKQIHNFWQSLSLVAQAIAV